ncbi:hypothetical protein D3C72_2183430 [compost metagenome]
MGIGQADLAAALLKQGVEAGAAVALLGRNPADAARPLQGRGDHDFFLSRFHCNDPGVSPFCG